MSAASVPAVPESAHPSKVADPSKAAARPAGPTVSDILLDYLALEGVTHLFGIPGGGVANLLNALRLREAEFDYVICKQETGAAYMADGFHRVTGRLGVVLVTTGPGALNALTGAMNAQADRSAVLTITGEVAERYFGKGYLQAGADGDLDVNAIYKNAVRYSALVASPDSFATLFTETLRVSLSTPFQATHISLPVDVSNMAPTDPIVMPASPERYRSKPRYGDRPKTAEALDLLLRAKRPLIMLGNGNRFALRGERLGRLQGLVDTFAIPVMTTPDGKALFPEGHAMALRNYGMAGCPWPTNYMKASQGGPAYDALLVVGSSLGELATNMWDTLLVPKGPFMQVDADVAVVGRNFPVDLGIVADAAQFFDDLFEAAEGRTPDAEAVAERRAAVAHLKRRVPEWDDPAKRDSDAVPLLPQAAMRVVNELLPSGSHVFVDCANCVGWSLNDLAFDPPTQMHLSLDMGPLGFGVCGVIGGKFGAPDRVCLAIVGDGAFLMHGTEVSTAARYGIGAIWIVLDNNDLAMVSQGNAHFFPEPKQPSWTDYYGLGRPDIAAVAAGLGADSYRVNSASGLRDALHKAIKRSDQSRRPQVIALEIDRSEVPPYYVPVPT